MGLNLFESNNTSFKRNQNFITGKKRKILIIHYSIIHYWYLVLFSFFTFCNNFVYRCTPTSKLDSVKDFRIISQVRSTQPAFNCVCTVFIFVNLDMLQRKTENDICIYLFSFYIWHTTISRKQFHRKRSKVTYKRKISRNHFFRMYSSLISIIDLLLQL